MNKGQVNSIVFETVAKITKRSPEELSPEHKLAEDLGMKSVSRIELAALLEDRLQTEISNFEIRVPKTMADLVEMVAAKI